MSLDLGSFASVPYNPGSGQKPSAMPIALCKPIDAQIGPKALRVDIPWTAAPYNASFNKRTVVVDLDLVSASVAGSGSPLDKIRFVTIDNTFNDVTVYARFNDTGQVVQCPPNSIVGAQVQSDNQKVTLFGTQFFTGRNPVSTFIFSNAPQEPYYIPDAGRYVVRGALSEVQYNRTNLSNYSFTNFKFGPAYTDRLCVLLVMSVMSAAGADPLTSVTWGGTALTKRRVDMGVANNGMIALYSDYISNGTQATLNVVMSRAANQCCVVGLALSDTTQAAPFDSDYDEAITLFTPNNVTNTIQAIPGAFNVVSALHATAAANLVTDNLNANFIGIDTTDVVSFAYCEQRPDYAGVTYGTTSYTQAAMYGFR